MQPKGPVGIEPTPVSPVGQRLQTRYCFLSVKVYMKEPIKLLNSFMVCCAIQGMAVIHYIFLKLRRHLSILK
jgi:hypothetical protein